MFSQRYYLQEPILSVQTAKEGQRECVYVLTGEVIFVEGETAANKQMVEVAWDSRKVLMFQRDIEDRAEPLS